MNYEFIKAMLQGYEQLQILADISDRKVMDIAIKSSGIDGQPHEIFGDIKAITDLTNYKIDLINLKVLVMDMINSLPYKYRQVARKRYIERKKVHDIAKMLGLSIRSIFRLLEDLPEVCNEYFIKNGFDDDWFLKTYGNQKWLMKLCVQKTKNTQKKEKPDIKIIPKAVYMQRQGIMYEK